MRGWSSRSPRSSQRSPKRSTLTPRGRSPEAALPRVGHRHRHRAGRDRRLPGALAAPRHSSPPTPARLPWPRTRARASTPSFRWASNKRLGNALFTLTHSTRIRNPWAADHYPTASPRGHNPRRALRTLAVPGVPSAGAAGPPPPHLPPADTPASNRPWQYRLLDHRADPTLPPPAEGRRDRHPNGGPPGQARRA